MGPIRGQTRPVPVPVAAGVTPQIIDVELNASIHNRFDIEVVNSQTGEVRQRAQAENIICNQMWNTYLFSYAWFKYIHVGSGTGTPSVTDSSLFKFLSGLSVSLTSEIFDKNSGTYRMTQKATLSESSLVGSTITEIGIAQSAEASTLCTHAMLVDMNGNHVSINKTATDIINIYATVFIHFPSVINSDTVIFGASSNELLHCLCGYKSNYLYNGNSVWARSRYGNGYGYTTTAITTSKATMSIDRTNKTLNILCERIDASSGNVGGIGAFEFGPALYLGKPYLLLLAKSNGWFGGSTITAEAVGTGDGSTTEFALAFPDAENATIYVNGAQATGVTVHKIPNTVEFSQDFNAVDANGNLDWHYIISQDYDGQNYNTGTQIWENPYYETIGVATVSGNTFASNDLSTWVQVASTVQTEYQNFRYWKTSAEYATFTPTKTKAVVFSSAPAEGTVITANYTTPRIAKDANHVFDLSVALKLGEYTA